MRQKELMEDESMYNMASEHNYPFALKLLDTLLMHSTQSVTEINLLAPFKEDSSFKEVAIDEFNFFSKTFIFFSKKIIEMKMKMESGKASRYD